MNESDNIFRPSSSDRKSSEFEVNANDSYPSKLASSSELLNKSIEIMLALIRNDEVKANYAKAVIMATKLWVGNQSDVQKKDGSLLRRPCSSEHIRIETSFNYKDQRAYRILLNKTEAIEFLEDMGKVIDAKSSFKKTYSNEKASSNLGRKAVSLGGKMLVCTYAEWLYMEDFAFEPALPQVLFDLIPQGWKCPDPEGTPGANLS
jgi:hypothetical protein